MDVSIPKGELYVEGADDEHAIKQLLARHDIHIHDEACPLKVHSKGSDSGLIDAITVALKSSGSDPVGFVIDTDAFKDGQRLGRADRWKAIRSRLVAAGVALNDPPPLIDAELPAGGFVAKSTKFDRTVGVWLMPDNRADYGKIEDLLATLIPQPDDVFTLAEKATTDAIAISAKRSAEKKSIQPKDERKGQLHSWLAWQEEPGMSYGHALRRKYFESNSSVALLFVAWFRQLYSM